MIVGSDLAAGRAITTGAGGGLVGEAQEPGREVEGEGGLADASWTHQQQGVGRVLTDHGALDDRERRGVAPGQEGAAGQGGLGGTVHGRG